MRGMFKKVNNVFRPNYHGHRAHEHGLRSRQDYHNACTVRLVRSTSMLVIGEKTQTAPNSTLKRSKSSVSIESTTALYYYQRQEDQIWLYSQNQNCLEYLEELVALRRQYTRSVHDLTSSELKASVSTKKRAAPPPPPKHAQRSSVRPSAPPFPNEDDTLQYFDAVIDSCDADRARKPPADDGNADVDFIVASSSKEHDLHSNWVMRVPRVSEGSREKAAPPAPGRGSASKKKSSSGSTSSRLRLQRNPIHLPKVVESAFQTLRFKPNLKKQ
ncbi:uncharacterized protein C13orf42 [Gadus morhua]|uniref:uncharacterized protein C13orf42 n=1 Tax=Gadus morhua TaxID=8049 RepID=UPI0011B83655|nr:uncharacterized protein C13orf42 homolog [Gadus morhua]